MHIVLLGKFPPIQGGVSAATYWTASALADRGHEVQVVTHSDEVEAGFRAFLYGEDAVRLGPSPSPATGSVAVHRTTPLARHSYIPWAPPYASQLFGLAHSVVERHGCDLILGWYFQPFGLVAAQLGTALRIPYVLRHAGSDIGRLAEHPDLSAAYRWMLRGATAVLTTSRTGEPLQRLQSLGVQDKQIRRLGLSTLPRVFGEANAPLDVEALVARLPDWYGQMPYRHELVEAIATTNAKPFDPRRPTIGAFGKVGETKGSFDLLSALAQLAYEDVPFQLLILAGGTPARLDAYYRALLDMPQLRARTWILPLLGPWRIPSFLRRCNVVCFLERDFPIAFHTPSTPREILASGACAVLSAEVADKQPFAESLSDDRNYVRIDDPRDHPALAARLASLLTDPERMRVIGRHGQFLSATCERFFRPTNATADALDAVSAELQRQPEEGEGITGRESQAAPG